VAPVQVPLGHITNQQKQMLISARGCLAREYSVKHDIAGAFNIARAGVCRRRGAHA
jgi:hypothetical protein